MNSDRKNDSGVVVAKTRSVAAWKQRRGQGAAPLSRGANGTPYSAAAVDAFARQIDALVEMKADHATVVGFVKTVLRR